MNMQSAAPAGRTMVTVAEAARLLSLAGDRITAPNVSRYLQRFPAIPSEKIGRERKVDFAALLEHRQTNIRVADKQASRAEPEAAAPEPLRIVAGAEPAGAESADTMAALNFQIKRLELKQKQREEDLAAGTVVLATEVQEIIGAVLQTFVAALERHEVDIAQRFGREISAAVRKGRKGAQAEASRTLIDMAQRRLPQSLGGTLADAIENVPDDMLKSEHQD